MTACVVDTNVLVVANQQSDHVGQECVDRCTKKIIELEQNGVVLLDTDDQVWKEYFKS